MKENQLEIMQYVALLKHRNDTIFTLTNENLKYWNAMRPSFDPDPIDLNQRVLHMYVTSSTMDERFLAISYKGFENLIIDPDSVLRMLYDKPLIRHEHFTYDFG